MTTTTVVAHTMRLPSSLSVVIPLAVAAVGIVFGIGMKYGTRRRGPRPKDKYWYPKEKP